MIPDFDVVVIGAGASGVMAAISAKLHHPDKRILLLERQDKMLNKVRASGNGRCNLSNTKLKADNYFSVQASDKQKNKYVTTAIHQFNFQATKKFFSDRGLFLRTDNQGRVYPYAQQAELVIDCLKDDIERLKIESLLNTQLTDIITLNKPLSPHAQQSKANFKLVAQTGYSKTSKSRFDISSGLKKEWTCQNLILACGSNAARQLGGCHAGYDLLDRLKVAISDLRPALVPLVLAEDKCRKTIQGQRFKGVASLYENKKNIFQTSGEFLFTKTGLSGIAAMELARFIKKGKTYHVKLDFIPELSAKELQDFFLCQTVKVRQRLFSELAKGFVRKKIADYLALKSDTLQDLIVNLKSLTLEVKGTLGEQQAQVMAGGILLDEIYFPSFNLKKYPHIYVCGELTDIDGRTGGFNLQWAWTSGYLAGKLTSTF